MRRLAILGPILLLASGDGSADAVLHVDAFRQDGSLAWCRTVADAPWDRAAIGISPAGGFVTAFSARGRGPAAPTAVLAMAFDINGDLTWSVSVQGETGAAEIFTAMAFDPKGGTWLASKQAAVPGGAGRDIWIFRRFTAAGRLTWTRSACFGTCTGVPTALVPAPDGVVIIGIEEKLSVAAHVPVHGWPDWSWVDDRAHLTAAAPLADGGLVAAGVRPAPGGSLWELVRLTAAGGIVWTRTAGTQPHPQSPARAYAVTVAKDGDLLVAGTVTGPSVPPGTDWLIRRYSPDGAVRWEQTWNSLDDRLNVSDDAPAAIAAGPDGAAYVLGTGRRGDAAAPWLMKYSAAGELLWSRTAPGDRALGVTPDGLILTAGAISDK